MLKVLSDSIDVRRVIILSSLLIWCIALITLRVIRTDTKVFIFLCWNLFLAAIPLMASTMLKITEQFKMPVVIQLICFSFWLVFFPNAPYILTDLIHLMPRPPVPLWYDLALLLSFSGTGLLVGYLSLDDVQNVITRRFGAVAGWLAVIISLMLTGFGIYLGRFLRWNSWDVLTNPSGLFADLADRALNPFSHPRTLAVTVIFGVALTLGYVALRVLMLRTEDTGLPKQIHGEAV